MGVKRRGKGHGPSPRSRCVWWNLRQKIKDSVARTFFLSTPRSNFRVSQDSDHPFTHLCLSLAFKSSIRIAISPVILKWVFRPAKVRREGGREERETLSTHTHP